MQNANAMLGEGVHGLIGSFFVKVPCDPKLLNVLKACRRIIRMR